MPLSLINTAVAGDPSSFSFDNHAENAMTVN
jgi:hypothetical protein